MDPWIISKRWENIPKSLNKVPQFQEKGSLFCDLGENGDWEKEEKENREKGSFEMIGRGPPG